MKNLIYIFIFVCSLGHGQHAPFSPKCKEVTAWTAQLSTYPSPKTVTAVNLFIIRSLNNSNWSKLDRFWLLAQDIETNAKISIANPTSTAITSVNSPTFTAYNGYQGNGSSQYLNTNFNPGNGGTYKFLQNDAEIGFYSLTNNSGNKADIGAIDNPATGSGLYSNIRSAGGTYNWTLNANSSVVGSTNTDSRGLFSLQRTASNLQTSYKNGVSFNTDATVSQSIKNLNIFIMAWNNSGTAGVYSDRKIAITYMGGALTQSTFYADVQYLATLLGFNQ